MKNNCRKITRVLTIIYFLAELMRIGSLLAGGVIFKLSTNNIGAGSSSPVPQAYYFLGETFRPIMSGVSIASGIILVVFAFFALIYKKENLRIFKKMLMMNSFIIVLSLYLLYVAAILFGITPAIYNYCTYNLSSIIIILLLCGVSFIVERYNEKKERK